MNANKNILVLAAASLMALSACGKDASLTRAQAEEHLDAISKATPAEQKKLTINNGADVRTYDAESGYIHAKFTQEADEKNSNPAKNNIEIYAYVKDGVGSLYYTDGETKTYYVNSSIADTIKSAAKSKVAAKVSASQAQAKTLFNYFKDADSADADSNKSTFGSIEAGATDPSASWKAYLTFADEKYTSSGEGNLLLEWTAIYPTEKPAEEPLVYEWKDNLLVHTKNGKSGAESTFNYGKADLSYVSSNDGYTQMSALEAAGVATIIALA